MQTISRRDQLVDLLKDKPWPSIASALKWDPNQLGLAGDDQKHFMEFQQLEARRRAGAWGFFAVTPSPPGLGTRIVRPS